MAAKTKAKKMNRVEAWMYLAEKWASPLYLPDNSSPQIEVGVDSTGYTRFTPGICWAIDGMLINGMISRVVRGAMLVSLMNQCPKGKCLGSWFFPLTKYGARKRAALCRNLAKQAEKEEAAKMKPAKKAVKK